MDVEKKKKIIREIKSIVILVVVIFAFRSTFFEPFRIPSGSMIPTLMIGDFLLVNKFAYGFKVPFSDMYTDPVYIYKREPPKRGDVIIFKYPKDPSLNYIKRVIGLPGDTVEMVDKQIFVNGQLIETKEFDGTKIMSDMDDSFKAYRFKFYKTQTGEHNHTIQLTDDSMVLSSFPKIEVPANHYFVMGDNRDFSADSRYWGFVPFENIKGEALFVWFSFILPFSETPMKFRPHRIGTSIY